MPAGGVTTQAEFKWRSTHSGPAVFDTTGSSYTLGPAAAEHPYSKKPWSLFLDDLLLGWISYDVSAYETIKSLSVVKMDNMTMTTRGRLGEEAEVAFAGVGADRSFLDMCDPVGGRKTGALPMLTFFDDDQFQSAEKYPTARLSFSDLTSVLPSCALLGDPLFCSHLLFSGGDHTVLGTFLLGDSSASRCDGETRMEATDGARVALKGEVILPLYRCARLLATDGATLTINKMQYGTNKKHIHCELIATNHATLAVSSAVVLGNEQTAEDFCFTTCVQVADSTLKVTSNSLSLGNPVENEGDHLTTLALTNAQVIATNAANSTAVSVYNGTVTSKETDWTASIVSLKASNPAHASVLTFDGGRMDISNRLELVGWGSDAARAYTNRFVQHAGTVCIPDSKTLKVGVDKGTSLYELKGGTLEILNGEFHLASTAGARGEMIVDGENALLKVREIKNHSTGGNAAGAVSVLRVKKGTVDVACTTARRIFVPHAANATSIVEVTGGTLTVGGWGFGATFGTAIMDFKGGNSWLQRLAVGTEASETPETVVTVSGGTLTVPPYSVQTLAPEDQAGIQITGNKGTNRRARLCLNGGLVTANRIVGGIGSRCNGGTGWTVLEGDGGTVKLNGIGYQMINGFDEANLGQEGLTIDSNGYTAHIRQNFKNKANETGRLILTGTGEKILYGTASSQAELVAAGGTVTFAEGARYTGALVVTNGAAVTFSDEAANGVTALTVGDGTARAGVLNLDAGRTVRVNGPVTLRNVRVNVTGAPGTGNDYVLLTSTEPFDEASKAAWKQATAQGLGGDQACDLEDATDEQGRYLLRMRVRARQDRVITLENGVSNVTEEIVFSSVESLRTVVAEGAALTLEGRVSGGRMIKEGNGRTLLTNTANVFNQGISVTGGMLSGTSLAALGAGNAEASIRLGTATLAVGSSGESGRLPHALTIETANPTDAAVLLCRADVTMAAPVSQQGCLIKRGGGRLVYETDRPVRLGENGGCQTDKNAAPAATTVTFDENGIPPAVQYTTLNVAEGDLVLKGTGPDAHFQVGNPATSALASTYVGMPVRGLAAQPRLIVDGARATLQKNAHFHLGSGCQSATSDAVAPMLVLTNGAVFTTTSFQNGLNADNNAYHGRVHVDGSTFDFTEYVYVLRRGAEQANRPTWLFTNGAQLLSPNDNAHAVTFGDRPCTMVFDRSVFKGREGVPGGRGRVYSNSNGAAGTMVFKNGALFRCDTLVWHQKSASLLTLTFDDAAWDPADGDYTFTAGDAAHLLVLKTDGAGRGLVLAPRAGATWTMAHPVTGTGGVTKEGAGTLVFAAAPVCRGAVHVTEGLVSFGNLAASGLTLKGSGTVAGGDLTDTTYRVTLDDDETVSERLTFSDVTFSGATTVDLGRTEATAFVQPYPTDVAVARYTGAAPDVSNWRAGGLGTKKVKGSFTAADGEIRMTLSYIAGLTVLVK